MSARESCRQGMEPIQERRVLQSTKLEGQSHLSSLTSDMESQALKLALLNCFDFSLIHLLHYNTIPPFWNGNRYSRPLYIGTMRFYFKGVTTALGL